MSDCEGSASEHIQADCGAAGPHPRHPLTTRTCPGAAQGFEGDCGFAGQHGEHPIDVQPEVTR